MRHDERSSLEGARTLLQEGGDIKSRHCIEFWTREFWTREVVLLFPSHISLSHTHKVRGTLSDRSALRGSPRGLAMRDGSRKR